MIRSEANETRRQLINELVRRGITFVPHVRTTESLQEILDGGDELRQEYPHLFRGNSVLVRQCPFDHGDMWKTGQWIQCESCGAVADPFVGIVTPMIKA